MEPTLPTGNNINWTLAISALAMILSYFHIVVPPEIQTAALTVISAGTVIVLFVLHNLVNKPANLAAAKAMATHFATKSVSAGRVITPALLALLLLPAISGCALFGGGSNAGFTALADADLVAGGLQTSLIAVCGIGTGGLGAPAQCSDPNFKASVKKADAVMVGCFGDALVVAEANGSTQAQIEAAVTSALACYATLDGIYQPAKKADTRKKLDPETIITILQVALQIGTTLYNDIMQFNQQGGVTISQLQALQAQLAANDAVIQAW